MLLEANGAGAESCVGVGIDKGTLVAAYPAWMYMYIHHVRAGARVPWG